MKELHFTFEDVNLARTVFGETDRHVALVEEAFGVEIQARGNELTFRGKAVASQDAKRFLQEMYKLAEKGHAITASDTIQAIKIFRTNPSQPLSEIFLDTVTVSNRQHVITPKTIVQKKYVDSMRNHDIVFGWGPAGTGKTYLAMATAVAALSAKEVEHIILARPAVEAGERLGFLPGDLIEKVNPYLRPLYDALHDMMDLERAQKLIDRGIIEVAPLAFMRGRTLNKSFVILDEAQNTTREQMKMFLTRLGFDSKAVITGDITQIDLPDGKRSGLIEAINLLGSIDGIGFVEFSEQDVVRHPLVQKIITAYEAVDHHRG